jgi:hypothetical protein
VPAGFPGIPAPPLCTSAPPSSFGPLASGFQDAWKGNHLGVPREVPQPKKEETVLGTLSGMLALSGGAATILWIIAVVLVIAGIVTLIRGGVLAGVALIIVGLLIGPGGVSIFH